MSPSAAQGAMGVAGAMSDNQIDGTPNEAGALPAPWHQCSLLSLAEDQGEDSPLDCSPDQAKVQPLPAAAQEAADLPASSLASDALTAPALPPVTTSPPTGLAPVPAPQPSSGQSCRLTDPRPAAHSLVCPRILLIIDTETTGLDIEQDRCIELGAILFSVPDRAVLSQVSVLFPCERNPAEAINHIPAALTSRFSNWREGLTLFSAMAAEADAVLAHNAAFDRVWFGHGLLPGLDLPWICSMDDLRWPAGRGLKPRPSLRDLALAYGIPVWAAHRALTDCIYLAQVLERCDNLESLLEKGLLPRHTYRAQVSYEERHLAKAAGFRWNEALSGAWSRTLSEEEVSDLPFPVQRIEDAQCVA